MEHTENSPFRKVALVILDAALKPLDYGIPSSFLESVDVGSKVGVTLRGKNVTGYVVAVKEKSDFPKLLSLDTLFPQEEALPKDLVELALWMEKYYMAPLWSIFRSIVPSHLKHGVAKVQYYVSLAKSKEKVRTFCKECQTSSPPQARVLEELLSTKKPLLLTSLMERCEVSKSPIETLEKKGWLSLEKLRIFRSPFDNEEYFKTLPKTLNEAQKNVLLPIQKSIEEGMFSPFLLHGITGSGKTEIYLQAIEKALSLKKGSIMLVPEISLTVQTVERFRSRFEGKIAILHHRLSEGERYDEWTRILKNEAPIVIGARSALFSPVHNLGLIIVDEEHDSAYKQQEKMPTYHARDAAIVRAKLNNGSVILGSATPSLESYYNATIGKYKLLTLPSRASDSALPRISLVDMKKECEKASGYTLFSAPLIDGIKKRLDLGEQTILFLNRRGYHTSFLCNACGYIFKCPHCEIPFTFHYNDNTLSCHLCDVKLSPPPSSCKGCGSLEMLKYKGVGTELIERSLHALFPGIRTLRIDGDTTKHKGSYESLYRQFRTGKSDVLIGTQMIAKGLHFPSVTLVAILNSDASLQIPDFRSTETTFQLITQVAGRAGRGSLPGEVIIQTKLPSNGTLQFALKQEFEPFFKNELEVRKAFLYPPFTHFIKFLFEGESLEHTLKWGKEFRKKLGAKLGKYFAIHPLIPAGYPKINNIYRFQFLLRGGVKKELFEEIRDLKNTFPLPKEIRLTIDVDPISTFF